MIFQNSVNGFIPKFNAGRHPEKIFGPSIRNLAHNLIKGLPRAAAQSDLPRITNIREGAEVSHELGRETDPIKTSNCFHVRIPFLVNCVSPDPR
jgi:hypothetical protein